jgi:uncharacterized protein YkwD
MIRTRLATALLAALLLHPGEAPAQSVSCGQTPAAVARDLTRQVNAQRAAQGLSAVAASPRLDAVAQAHACDMARRGRMGHDGSDGSNLGQRLGRGGYRFGLAAENIAHGFDSVAAVTQSWMQSPGHRANILRPAATDLGVGVAQPAEGRPYWVLLLAAPL